MQWVGGLGFNVDIEKSILASPPLSLTFDYSTLQAPPHPRIDFVGALTTMQIASILSDLTSLRVCVGSLLVPFPMVQIN